MNYLLYTIILVSSLISSEIMNNTLDIIQDVFPGSISIEHSMYNISEESVKKIQNTTKQKFFRPELNLWTILSKDSTSYYAILDNVKGKSLPITFLTIFNDSSEVHHTAIIKYREAFGGEVSSKKWLNQFTAYTDSSNYKVGRDISGISGATLSVHSITKGIHKLTLLIHEIIKDDNEK